MEPWRLSPESRIADFEKPNIIQLPPAGDLTLINTAATLVQSALGNISIGNADSDEPEDARTWGITCNICWEYYRRVGILLAIIFHR